MPGRALSPGTPGAALAGLGLLLVACTDAKPAPEDTAATPGPAPQLFAGNTYYAGDPHVHTGVSGDAESYDDAECPGCGRFGKVFEAAKAAGLSWIALSDHVNGYPAATAEGFADQQAAVQAAHTPEVGFATIPSAEVWFRAPTGDLGHETLLLFAEDVSDLALGDVLPAADGGMDVSACEDVWAWADALEARVGPLLLVPHHPAGLQPMPTDWTCHDAARQPVVEVYSEHGSALDDGFDPPWAGTRPAGTVPTALDPEGLALRMGFVAGTDSHDTLPGDVCALDLVRTDQPYGGGLTMAVLPEDEPLSREALLAAFQARRVYGTSGPAVALDVAWSAGGARLGGLGEEVVLGADLDLDVAVSLPTEQAAAVTGVELVGPGPFGRRALTPSGSTWTLTVPAAEVPAWLYVAVALDGAIVNPADCVDGGADDTEWVWGSPSWMRR